MTALCGGGTSSPKPGIPQNIAVSSGLITEGLQIISPWLLPFAILFDGFMVQAVTQCAQDPPAMPTFDATDVANLVGGVLNPNLNVTLTKVNNLLLNYAWSKFCRCDAVSTPTPWHVLQPPANAILPSSSTPNGCFQGNYAGIPTVTFPFGPTVWGGDDVSLAVLPSDGVSTQHDFGTGLQTVYHLRPGLQTLQILSSGGTQNTGQPFTYAQLQFNFANQDFGGQPQPSFGISGWNDGAVHSATIGVSPATYWFGVRASTGQTSSYGNALTPLVIQVNGVCTGGQNLSGCCPPDPSLTLGIQQIIQQLNVLVAGHNATPWIDGVRHAGLSGAGSFALTGNAIGIRVEAHTPLPAGTSYASGTPTFYYGLGYLNPIAVGSPLRGWRLNYVPESFPLPPFTDSIGYTLQPGVTVDVVELLP